VTAANATRMIAAISCVAAFMVSGCAKEPIQITILATNDIHGGIEPTTGSDGTVVGGLAALSGVVKAIRAGLKNKLGERGGVLVVDAGDQFQGTLISNHNEGQLVFKAMSQVGYDVAIAGNHAYDFGPVGWLEDEPNTPDQDPRGALKAALTYANFPLISANTFLRSSLRDATGNQVQVDQQGCVPKVAGNHLPAIDWGRAARPDFLKPYLLKEVAGVRVAIIGIDNVFTPTTTTAADVNDLCFEREADAYLRSRALLDGQADVFVLLIHDGNTRDTNDLSALVESLMSSAQPKHGAVVDAVISGHTHATYNRTVGEVPVIQSGSGGDAYGRVDLLYDPKLGGIDRSKTKSYAGVKTFLNICADAARDYCTFDPATNVISYEGAVLQNDDTIVQLISRERQAIAPLAGQVLGNATAKITVDRVNESALADALTDILRRVSAADVALINTGGIRAPLDPGDVTYEALFRVIPFNNHGVVIGPMAASTLLKALTQSAQTCGTYGALMQSGLKIQIEKNCDAPSNRDKTDPNARLTHVETLEGKVLFDTAVFPIPAASDDPMLTVATLDFLAAGGSGYDMFKGVPRIKDIGIVRETMKDTLARAPATFTADMDGRWTTRKPPH
jgi:2',3'-cyclic-nucleotide 2'-phosphodiesterase (5'-nucleotidase family)